MPSTTARVGTAPCDLARPPRDDNLAVPLSSLSGITNGTAAVAPGVRTTPAMSWRRVGRPILLHPDVVGLPLVKYLAAPGLATQCVDNPQQTLLRPGIRAL